MQALRGDENRVSAFYLKVDSPGNINSVEDEIKATPGMQQYGVRSMGEYLSMMTPDNLPGFNVAIEIVIGIAIVVGFLVIFQSMYTAVMERTREIGILKSLGASKIYVVRLILRETLLLAIAGVLVGFVLSALGRLGILHRFPTLSVLPINLRWALYSTLIAIGGAIMGAVYPAFKAAQKDPIDALAYE